uniref:XS domain-containing protein n=1 Tax=Arundo donax TaxID=35708 RepID=A0A0A9GAE6_ARUDO
MGFAGADVQVQPLPGKGGQRSMQVRFPGSLDGLNKASQLVELFEREGHGRPAWACIRSIAHTAEGANNPMLVKVDAKGTRTWVLYGYLATAWDLDTLDAESKQNATIKSRKELDSD